MPLEELDWWWDPVARSGHEAMAVDEWLLETARRPVLRVYSWKGRWASIGYFGDWETARAAIPDRLWVRRRTGGGVVDHANDWTYTLVVPRQYPLARQAGADRYRLIHESLVAALAMEGIRAGFSLGQGATDQALCFQNPVPYDLLSGNEKLAGAGQRRNRLGLLHQGSVAGSCAAGASLQRAGALARSLCRDALQVERNPPVDVIPKLAGKYLIPG